MCSVQTKLMHKKVEISTKTDVYNYRRPTDMPLGAV
jgi:hypothetical protein